MLSLEFDISIVYQMVLFIVLIFVMNKLIYAPLSKVVAERKKRIDRFSGGAASIEKEIENKLSEYNLKVAEAREIGSVERMKLKKEAAEKEVAIVETARLEAQKAMEEAKVRIDKETKAALSGLKKMKENIGKEIAEKALGRPI